MIQMSVHIKGVYQSLFVLNGHICHLIVLLATEMVSWLCWTFSIWFEHFNL